MKRIIIGALLITTISVHATEQITAIGWNAKSGDASPNVVADRIKEIDGWTWKAESTILQRDGTDTNDNSFPDDNQTSDHRPVRAEITIE